MGDTGVVLRTVIVGSEIAGNVVAWEQDDQFEVGYWIAREHWGRGVATEALSQFLDVARARPLYAYVAPGNRGSIRVLEKCGFTAVGDEEIDGITMTVLILEG